MVKRFAPLQSAPLTTPYPADIMFLLAAQVGEVAGGMKELTKRLDDIGQGQRDQAVAVEQLSQDTADFRQETAEALGSMQARLHEGDRRMGEMAGQIAALQAPRDRPPPGVQHEDRGKGKRLTEIVSWTRENWGWLFTFGSVLSGVAWNWWHQKGGKP